MTYQDFMKPCRPSPVPPSPGARAAFEWLDANVGHNKDGKTIVREIDALAIRFEEEALLAKFG